MAELVTLLQVKRHLRLPAVVSSPIDDMDQDLQDKIDQATTLVLDYVRQRRSGADEWLEEVEGWDADTAPKQVIAAILVMTGELWRWRGDDSEPPRYFEPYAALSPQVTRLLVRLRDPAVS